MSYVDVFGNQTLPPSEYGYRSFNLTADTQLSWPYNTDTTTTAVAKIMDAQCSVGVSVILPDATEVSVGEDFMFRNVGAQVLTVKSSTGTTLYSVQPGAAIYFYLTDNTTAAGVFGSIPFGVGAAFVDAASLVGYGIKAIGSTLNQAHTMVDSAGSITVDSTYRAKLLNFTGGASTLNLPDVSGVGNDFFFLVRNSGTGTVSIDGNGSQTVDGQLTLTLQPGESLMLVSSGLAWFSVGYGRSTLFQFTQLVKDVSAGGTIALTSNEVANKLITFVGNPSGAVTVTVPTIVSVYYLYNSVSTAQSVTVKTPSGTGVVVGQGARAIVLCDGTNVISAVSISASSTISVVDGSVGTPSIAFASQTNTGVYKYGTQGFGVAVNGVNLLQLEATRALITQPQDYVDVLVSGSKPAYKEGRVFYDQNERALSYYNEAVGVTVNLGQETLVRVRNISGSTITNGSVVYISGAFGGRPTVTLAQANSSVARKTLGVCTADILNGADGYATVLGLVNGLNTSGYTVGDTVYLSAATAGVMTNVKPSAPNYVVAVGTVTTVDASVGAIFVKTDSVPKVGELNDVVITTPADGQVLSYNSGSQTWVNTTNAGGDVSGPASSVDSEVALFSGTGGKTLKRATGSGIAKLTSGVLGTATAGTDFARPDTASSWTAEQTFKEVKDTVFTITDGAGFSIDPANGSVQIVTIAAGRTPVATNFEAGQTVLLGISGNFAITWTSVNPTWVKAGGTAAAPSAAASGYLWVLLWKVGTTMYAAEVGKV